MVCITFMSKTTKGKIVQSFAVKELHLKVEDETNSFHIS